MLGTDVKTVLCRMPSGLTGVSALQFKIDGIASDHITKIIEDTGKAYEFNLLSRLCAVLKTKPRHVVDIGANIGNHSVFFATVLGAKVLAVEPNTQASELLTVNMNRIGGRDVWRLLECGVGETEGFGSLKTHVGNLGATELIMSDPNGTQGCGGIEVRTLQRVLEESERELGIPVDLVKIDIEGMEVGAIRSGLEYIKAHRPTLVVEISNDSNLKSIITMLSEFEMEFLGPFCATPTYIVLPKCRYSRIGHTVWRVAQQLF